MHKDKGLLAGAVLDARPHAGQKILLGERRKAFHDDMALRIFRQLHRPDAQRPLQIAAFVDGRDGDVDRAIGQLRGRLGAIGEPTAGVAL